MNCSEWMSAPSPLHRGFSRVGISESGLPYPASLRRKTSCLSRGAAGHAALTVSCSCVAWSLSTLRRRQRLQGETRPQTEPAVFGALADPTVCEILTLGCGAKENPAMIDRVGEPTTPAKNATSIQSITNSRAAYSRMARRCVRRGWR